jgi:hypothetical protein
MDKRHSRNSALADSFGGVAAQPALGRAADVWGYPASYVLSGGLAALAVPFLYRSRQQPVPADAPDIELVPDAIPAGTTSGDLAA